MKTLRFTFVLMALAASMALKAQETAIYIHQAVDSNTSLHITTLDHDGLNDAPNRFPVFTHNYNPPGQNGKYVEGILGIYYIKGRWRIYDESFNEIPAQSNYNVLLPSIGTLSWVHKTNKTNTTNAYTLIDHSKLNGNPNAKLFVSHMWNPDGGAGVYHTHRVGVFYASASKKWAIYNEDKSPMPEGLGFNVVVVPSSSDIPRFTAVADSTNTKGHIIKLDHPDLNNNPKAKIVISHLWDADKGSGGIYYDHSTGVYYNGTKWCIYTEDKTAMPQGIAFEVVILNDSEQTASNNEMSIQIPSLKVGPNPVSSGQALNIGLYNAYGDDLKIQLIDIQGKVHIERSLAPTTVIREQLPTDGLNPGMYMLRIYGDKTNATRRIVIR